MDICLVCANLEGQKTLLTEMGKTSIFKFAKLQKDENVIARLKKGNAFFVHKDCQKFYTNKRRIEREKKQAVSSPNMTATRSQMTGHCWKTQCFFCQQQLSKKNI